MAVSLDLEQTETRVIHQLVDFTGADVLEIGCGDGRLTWRFAALTRSVLALDPVAASIETAQADLPAAWRDKLRFQIGDITTVVVPAAAFDVAVLSWSLC